MSSLKLAAKAAVIIAAAALHANAQAMNCFDRSPNYENDDYFNLEQSVKLSSREQQELDKLFRSIKGDWQGDGEKHACYGNMKSPQLKSEPLEVQAELAPQQKGVLRLEEELRFPQAKRNQNQVMKLSHSAPNMSFELRGDQLFVSERYRRRSGANSVFVENIYEIVPRGRSLEVVKSYYIGGYLAAQERRFMQRVK